MQDHDLCLRSQTGRLWCGIVENSITDLRGVCTIVASEQGRDELREDRPYELLIRILVGLSKFLDKDREVSSAAVLHVHMKVLRSFDVFSVIVFDDIRMAQGIQDRELGVQLISLFHRHLHVADLLSYHYLIPPSDGFEKPNRIAGCTFPSERRRTFFMVPKEPRPDLISSNNNYIMNQLDKPIVSTTSYLSSSTGADMIAYSIFCAWKC